jgi:putative ABC transport system permease protein
MLLVANLRLGLRALLRAPLRSFLVLQGIAWGVGIAFFPAAVLEGSRRTALERADEVGTGRVTVEAEPGSRPLAPADLAALRAGIPGFAPFDAAPVRIDRAAGEGAVHVLGTDPAGLRARYQALLRGRYLEERDAAEGATSVCVLEPAAAAALAPGADPLGRKVRLREGLEAEVVGLLAPRTARALRTDDFGLEVDHAMTARVWAMLASFGLPRPDDAWKRSERCAHVPLRLLAREGEALDALLVRSTPAEAPALADALRAALVARGASPVAHANLVWPILASGNVERFLLLKDALVLACLAMGGIVIANVMLLTLLERTGEIAVRRAEGATRGDIVAQFLAEAAVLGVSGSLLGVPLGMLLAWIRLQFGPFSLLDVAFPAGTAALAAAVGVATALLAGALPARRAAALDPAAALREA